MVRRSQSYQIRSNFREAPRAKLARLSDGPRTSLSITWIRKNPREDKLQMRWVSVVCALWTLIRTGVRESIKASRHKKTAQAARRGAKCPRSQQTVPEIISWITASLKRVLKYTDTRLSWPIRQTSHPSPSLCHYSLTRASIVSKIAYPVAPMIKILRARVGASIPIEAQRKTQTSMAWTSLVALGKSNGQSSSKRRCQTTTHSSSTVKVLKL